MVGSPILSILTGSTRPNHEFGFGSKPNRMSDQFTLSFSGGLNPKRIVYWSWIISTWVSWLWHCGSLLRLVVKALSLGDWVTPYCGCKLRSEDNGFDLGDVGVRKLQRGQLVAPLCRGNMIATHRRSWWDTIPIPGLVENVSYNHVACFENISTLRLMRNGHVSQITLFDICV